MNKYKLPVELDDDTVIFYSILFVFFGNIELNIIRGQSDQEVIKYIYANKQECKEGAMELSRYKNDKIIIA